ncbi:MAG: hypothetical protein HRT68_04225 [Flavobacteriaceae bacterium]|nr:hypothetical protein [Flavobacteriaceae bacterium]
MKENMSFEVDYGYDTKMIETNPTDANWVIDKDPFVIQTIGTIQNQTTTIPILVKASVTGKATFFN